MKDTQGCVLSLSRLAQDAHTHRSALVCLGGAVLTRLLFMLTGGKRVSKGKLNETMKKNRKGKRIG